MTQRMHRTRAYAPDPAAPGRRCDSPGCEKAGEFRAPKSRSSLNDYHWFCLDHVRAYNASWDFYKGMTPGEIEAHARADTSWQRPTWPLGRIGAHVLEDDVILDPLHVLAAGRARRTAARAEDAAPRPRELPKQLNEPLHTLGLGWPVSMDELKARYKELAKRHHPDANGGDRGAEERLKVINLAYAAIRSHLSEPKLAATG